MEEKLVIMKTQEATDDRRQERRAKWRRQTGKDGGNEANQRNRQVIDYGNKHSYIIQKPN